MDLRVLKQYADMRTEVKDLRNRIAGLEDQIRKYEDQPTARDIVKGGLGGLQNYHIEGFPYPEYRRKKILLRERMTRLENVTQELDEKLEAVDACIESVEDSRIRTILRLKYIDGKSWGGVAKALHDGSKADAVRKEHDRFMKKVSLSSKNS